MSKKHKKHAEEHENAERWLLTYADMITLLLALFIYLYSISEINATKLNAFTTSMASLFGIGRLPQSATGAGGGTGLLPAANSVVELRYKLQRELKELIDQGLASLEMKEDGLRLRLKDQVLFESGKVELTPQAKPVIDQVAKYLVGMPNKIRIEGHTDNIPMSPGGKYQTNWELSSSRASSVVRYLIENVGIKPYRLSVAGYAEYQPIAPNRPGKGSAENRRVELVILKSLSDINNDTTAILEDADIKSGLLQQRLKELSGESTDTGHESQQGEPVKRKGSDIDL